VVDDEREESPIVSSTGAMLLKAAAELLGGERILARRLGIAETLLAKFMADVIQLPDPLLLHVVDLVLDNQPARPAATAGTSVSLGGE
jgi:hypothetical protein